MGDNPFKRSNDNPFQGSNGAASDMNEVDLGDDNPYAQDNAYEYPVAVVTSGAYEAAPAQFHPTQPAMAGGAYQMTAAAASVREKDLAKREAALAARERALRTREQSLRPSGGAEGGAGRAAGANWPVCSPVLYHNIREEIPPQWQGPVTKAYWSYLALIVCLIWNFISVTTYSFGAGGDMTGFFMAVIYGVTAVPGALWLWYFRLYNAAMRNRAITFGWFFLVYFLHVAFCFWAAIAPPLGPSAFTGAFAAITAFNKGVAFGIMYIIGTVFWGFEALWSLLVFQQIYAQFRAGGTQADLQAQVGAASQAANAAATYGAATSSRV